LSAQITIMKLRNIALFIALIAFAQISPAQTGKYQLIVSGYTSDTKPEGISVYDFNAQTGELTYKNKVVVSNPTFMTIGPDKKHIYSVNEDRVDPGVSVFNYEASTGQLTLINRQKVGGTGPAYVSVDANSKFVFTANYNDGSLTALPIQKDGSIGSDIQVIKHEGKGPLRQQAGPHVHSVIVSPDNNYLFAVDLGTDKINAYRFDPKKAAPLSPMEPAFIKLSPGAAPRHFAFHPNKKFAYVIEELSGAITAFKYDKGVLTKIDTVSLADKGFTGTHNAADIHVSADGKFLYGSNRGTANDISIYSIDQNTGKMTFVGRQSSMGKSPRNFAIDPTGNFLLIANQDSNDVSVFKRDPKTGLITPTGKKIDIVRPTCLAFLKID
jgi:6-phosphogluconolactonase